MKHTGLIIRRPDGSIGDIALCNEKSRNKTVEQDELWIVDPETRRVLPYNGGGAACNGGFTDRDRWFEIFLAEPTVKPASEMVGGGTPAQDAPTPPGVATAPTAPPAPATSPAHAPAAAPAAESPQTNAEIVGTVLAELGEVIAERHQTLPEGSYTTHLFAKGPSKIRKKTGEEAVELILATEQSEIVSEAADLIYHMLVLLEAEGLSYSDVIAVLADRHREG